MKIKQLIMVALCAIAFTANAQTKGTNALSLGFGFGNQESKQINSNGTSEIRNNKSSSISLGYGLFFKENEKIALDLTYGVSTRISAPDFEQSFKNYGINASYQKYLPLIKKLYAHMGGRVGYSYGNDFSNSNNNSKFIANSYSVGVFGGISYFISKRFALETNILSADMAFNNSKTAYNSNSYQETSSNFSLSNQGTFSNLGFKIFLLF